MLAGTLTMLKALGIHAASHFTLQDYGTAFADRGLLNSTGLIGEQGTVWKTWHQTVGIAAVYAGRDVSPPSNLRTCSATGSWSAARTVRVVWATSYPGDADHHHRRHSTRPRTSSGPRSLPAIDTDPGALTDLPDRQQSRSPSPLAPPRRRCSPTRRSTSPRPRARPGGIPVSLTGSTYTNAAADAVNDRWTIPISGVWQITPTTGASDVSRRDRRRAQVDGARRHHQGQGDRHLGPGSGR